MLNITHTLFILFSHNWWNGSCIISPFYRGRRWGSKNSTGFPKVTLVRNYKAYLCTQFYLVLPAVAPTDIYLRILFLQMSQIPGWNWQGLFSYYLFSTFLKSWSHQASAVTCRRGKGRHFGAREVSWHLVPCEEPPFAFNLETQAWGQISDKEPVTCLSHGVEVCLLVHPSHPALLLLVWAHWPS